MGLVLAISAVTCGCWDSVELSQVAIVAGLGIDAVTGTDVKVTAQIAVPGKSSADMTLGKGGGPNQMPMVAYCGQGLNLADAITRGLYQVSMHKVFLSHVTVAVIGQEAAKRGIDPLMDHMLRHQEFRANMWVLVARSDAESVVKTPVDHEMVAARALVSLIQNEVRVGNARASQLHTFAEQMLDKTRAATTALVSVCLQDSKPALNVVGTAVIKGGKLIGELDERSTRGLMWALGEVKGGSVTVKCKCGGNCSIFVNRASGTIAGKMKDGHPQITVEIKMLGTADGLECSEDLTQPGTLEFLMSSRPG